MQIVIDIPDETYQVTLTKIMLACRGCRITELPKGHGRLIDADELYNSLEFPTQQFASAFKQMLDDAYTIIEADRSEEE